MVKVWRHLKHTNQCGYGVIVRLKFLVENTDAIPELRVFDIFDAVKCVLVSVECLVDFISQKTTMTQGHPGRTIVRLQVRHVLIVLDGERIIATSCTELSKLTEVLERQQRGWVRSTFSLNQCGIPSFQSLFGLIICLEELVHQLRLILVIVTVRFKLWLLNLELRTYCLCRENLLLRKHHELLLGFQLVLRLHLMLLSLNIVH